MDVSTDQHGEFIFTKQVMVDENSAIEYKYRHASGDWWALDPKADTATDDHGNVNSLVHAPTMLAVQEITSALEDRPTSFEDTAAGHATSDTLKDAETTPEAAETADTDTGVPIIDSARGPAENDDLRRLSLTPVEEVANTAAEVADTASHLDDDDLEPNSGDALMFSHERFASSSDHLLKGHQDSEPQYDDRDDSLDNLDQLNMDYDDPRLEHFPSDRDSIMATMRRLSTTVEADPTMVDSLPMSPIITAKTSVASSPSPSRTSFDIDDVQAAHKQTEDLGRQHIGAGTSRSSLQSISEGEELPNGDGAHDREGESDAPAQYIGPLHKRNFSLVSTASSNEDEGISMANTPSKRLRDSTHKSAVVDKALPTDTVDEATTSDTHPIEEQSTIASVSSKTNATTDQPDLQKPMNDGQQDPSPSTHPPRDKSKDNWLHTFLRMVFVDWIGGFVGLLCGRSRSEVPPPMGVSSLGAVIVLSAGVSLWALQDRLPSIGLLTSLGKST